MIYETVAGRSREETERLGKKCVGFIGKHIVGTGEDAHLTTKVYMDLMRPHVILICGKRGTGKSYLNGIIVEEILSLPDEFLNKTSVVVFDPVGIYWSMKFPNESQRKLLEEWDLMPEGFDRVKVFAPGELYEEYEKAGIPVDFPLFISPREFGAEDWSLAFGLERTSQFSIVLEKNLNSLLEKGENFSLEDIIGCIEKDERASSHVKDVLLSFLDVAKGWGIFSKEGMKIRDIVKPGQASVIDVSRVRGGEWGVRSLLAAWITREVYRERVLARKEEELAKMEGRKPARKFPLTWLIFEEAHNFVPREGRTVCSDAILTIAKQGREPGVSLIVITQMPNKIHQDVLSQCDLVFSLRLTSRDDLDALHTVMQTYVREDIERYMNLLPRWPGAAIILDDNLEKIFTVCFRPRKSHHAGGTAAIF